MKNSYGLYMECIFLVVACISFKKGQNSQMHLGEMNIYEAKHRPGKLNDYNIYKHGNIILLTHLIQLYLIISCCIWCHILLDLSEMFIVTSYLCCLILYNLKV